MERGGTGPGAGSRRARPAGTHVDGRRCCSVGLRDQERVHSDQSPSNNWPHSACALKLGRQSGFRVSRTKTALTTRCQVFLLPTMGTLVPILWDPAPLAEG